MKYFYMLLLMFTVSCGKNCDKVVKQTMSASECAIKKLEAMDCANILALPTDAMKLFKSTAFSSCNWPIDDLEEEDDKDICMDEITLSQSNKMEEKVKEFGSFYNKKILACQTSS